MTVRRLLFHTCGVLGMLLLISLSATWYWGHFYQREAQAFWGSEYAPSPSDNQLKVSFPHSWMMPRGGPTIAWQVSKCPGTMITPLVPMRFNGSSEFEVLCLHGLDTVTITHSVVDQDEPIQEALRLFQNEAPDSEPTV